MRQTELALAMAAKEMDGADVQYLQVPAAELLRERVASAIESTVFYRRLYEPFGAIPGRWRRVFGLVQTVARRQ